jgi:hypothetical protein
MANKFTRYLFGDGNIFNNVVGGLIKPKGNLANWQHATRIFVDDTFRLAPRHKFLYYVVFEIDNNAHNASAFTAKHSQEVSFLCKAVDLPKFNFDSVTKNQYNRKKLLYKSINYDSINITMHDDNSGISNAMWAIYYGSYIADRSLPAAAAYEDNKYRASGTSKDSFRYGLDNDKGPDFFKSISIYTMSRSRFNGYTLLNPRIKSWSHGNVDYADGGTIESSMTIDYEAVQYSSGKVATNSPKGFATLHYDTAPSPLSVQGGGVSTLTGEGGVLSGIEQIFGDVSNPNFSIFDNPGSALGTAIKAVNTYKNFKGLSKEGLIGEAVNILNSPAGARGIVSTVGGIVGSVFPKNTPSSDSILASAKKFFG